MFSDTMSGARDDRPGLAALMEYVREGDTVVVHLSCCGRSVSCVRLRGAGLGVICRRILATETSSARTSSAPRINGGASITIATDGCRMIFVGDQVFIFLFQLSFQLVFSTRLVVLQRPPRTDRAHAVTNGLRSGLDTDHRRRRRCPRHRAQEGRFDNHRHNPQTLSSRGKRISWVRSCRAAATGMATSAPTIPSSAPPIKTATTVISAGTLTARPMILGTRRSWAC